MTIDFNAFKILYKTNLFRNAVKIKFKWISLLFVVRYRYRDCSITVAVSWYKDSNFELNKRCVIGQKRRDSELSLFLWNLRLFLKFETVVGFILFSNVSGFDRCSGYIKEALCSIYVIFLGVASCRFAWNRQFSSGVHGAEVGVSNKMERRPEYGRGNELGEPRRRPLCSSFSCLDGDMMVIIIPTSKYRSSISCSVNRSLLFFLMCLWRWKDSTLPLNDIYVDVSALLGFFGAC